MNQSFNLTKKILTLVTIFLFCVLSCNYNTPSTENTKEKEDSSTQCYLSVRDRDSVKMTINKDGSNIHGKLAFINYGIDGSSGDIQGSFSGDTLWVMYHFQAEGMDNLKEEAFLKKDGKLWRGNGDQEETANGYKFVDRSQVAFGTFQILEPVSCL